MPASSTSAVAGHPEGHRSVGPTLLAHALKHKQAFARPHGHKVHIATQFGFDPQAICVWAAHLVEQGITLPVHVGIAGPTPLPKLIKFAMACGVGASLGSLMKNMSAMTNLARMATGPDQMMVGLLRAARPIGANRIVKPHFYAFGGVDGDGRLAARGGGRQLRACRPTATSCTVAETRTNGARPPWKSASAEPGAALICGSVAIDSIMVFGDRFKNHILPDKIHVLNVSFFVPQMRREFGGCAGNIAYNLKLLGDAGYPDGHGGQGLRASTREWMKANGVPLDYIRPIDTEHTAQAFITTDLDNNQITAFHPGAMLHSHANKVSDARGITIGIVAPDGREGMVEHAEQFAAAKIPFIFDPGQGLPMFEKADLERFVAQATLGGGQRVRVGDDATEDGLDGQGRPGAGRGADRDAGPQGSTSIQREGRLRYPAQLRRRWWTRPAAVMPIAPGCSTA